MPSGTKDRPERLEHGPMQYAPENELGVVFLFATLARRWRLVIEKIRPGFPDCIAYQKTQGRERRIRIEFEYRSRNFAQHRHRCRDCDWLVCWEHDWPGAPASLNIVELRREFGLGFNVWVQPVKGVYREKLQRQKASSCWSVPSRAHKGDLLLYYGTRPDMCIADIFELAGNVARTRARWKPGDDYMGSIRRRATLDSPIFLDDLRRHRILRTAGFVRGQMQGRPNVTSYSPYLYELIIKRNPSVQRRLERFDPVRLRI